MNSGSSTHLSLVQLLLPLVAASAIWSFAAFQATPSEAAETAYLAMLSCAVLLPAAALARSPAWALSLGTVLVTLAAWSIPGSPTRGATVSLLLLLTFVAIAWRWFSAQGLPSQEDRLNWAFAVPAALGVQYLFRADQLLMVQLDAKTLVGLFVLPLAAAAALVLLAAATSTRRALVSAAAVVVLAPGWSVTATLSLLAVALASYSRDSSRPHPLPAPLLWAAGLAVVGAAWFWQPSLAPLLALGMMAIVGTRSWKFAALVVVSAALLLAFGTQVRSWPETLSGLSVVLLLLPFALAPKRTRWPSVVAAAALGLVALRCVAGPEALAAPLGIFALGIPMTGTLARLQRTWSTLVVVGVLLLSTYPWLRHDPLTDLLGIFGLNVNWIATLAVVTAAAMLVLLASQLSRRFERAPFLVEGLTLAALCLAALIALPPVAVHPIESGVLQLDINKKHASFPLPEGTMVAEVVIDSYLSFAAMLPTGTPAAILDISLRDGSRQRWRLRTGIETGEWAARRPDVAAIDGFEAPPPWISWVVPTGDLFAQRYRSVWRLPEPVNAKSVEVELAPEVPSQLSMVLFHMELRP